MFIFNVGIILGNLRIEIILSNLWRVTQTSPLFVTMIFEGRYTKLSLPYFSGRENNINTNISKCLSSHCMKNMAILERLYKNTSERMSNTYFCNKENFDRLTQISMNIVDMKTESSESRIIWRKKRQGLSSMDQIIK